jgi:molybdate transport system regulatory protein
MSSEVQNNKKKHEKGTESINYNENNTLSKVSPKFRLWLEIDDKSLSEEEKALLGKGSAVLLERIAETGSISDAIRDVPSTRRSRKKTGLSYRYAWGLLKKISDRLKKPIIQKFRGGRKGGGTELTQLGEDLLRYYTRLETLIQATLADKELWEAISLKLGVYNRFLGEVDAIEQDATAAKVKVKVLIPATITAIITAEATNDLNLKEGDEVKAIIKSTEILLAHEN